MGYTSVRKCILIEIRTKFHLIHEKEWTGDTISNICKRYGVSRKTYYKWMGRYKHTTNTSIQTIEFCIFDDETLGYFRSEFGK